MEDVFEAITDNGNYAIKGDFVDKLHSKRTVYLLFLICILVALKQYDDDGAIACWLPTSLSDDQSSYAHQLCWVNNTYYFPGLDDADYFKETRRYAIPYYQFILFILIAQAFSFYVPNLIWKYLTSDCAIYMKNIIDEVDISSTYFKKFSENVTKKEEEQEKDETLIKTVKRIISNQQGGKMMSRSSSVTSQNNTNNEETNTMITNRSFTNSKIMPTLSENDNNNPDSLESTKEVVFNSDDLISNAADFKKENFIMQNEIYNDIKDNFMQLTNLKRSKPKRQLSSSSSSKNHQHQPRTLFSQETTSLNQSVKLLPTSSLVDHKRMASVDSRKSRFSSAKTFIKEKLFRHLKPAKAVKNLAFYYFFCKLLNLLNIVMQFFLLTYIFGNEFYRFGIEFIERVFVSPTEAIFNTKQFPILTFCDFYVHQNLGQIHFNTAQCLLHINVIIEKFYIVIWFWLVMLFVITLLNILDWLYEIYSPNASHFLAKYISIRERMQESGLLDRNSNNNNDNSIMKRKLSTDSFSYKKLVKETREFQKQHLEYDGLLMMHIIKNISGPILFTELLHRFWNDWKDVRKTRSPPNDD